MLLSKTLQRNVNKQWETNQVEARKERELNRWFVTLVFIYDTMSAHTHTHTPMRLGKIFMGWFSSSFSVFQMFWSVFGWLDFDLNYSGLLLWLGINQDFCQIFDLPINFLILKLQKSCAVLNSYFVHTTNCLPLPYTKQMPMWNRWEAPL